MEKRRQQAFSAWAGHQFSIYKLKNLQFTNKQVSNIKFTPIIREHIFVPVHQNLSPCSPQSSFPKMSFQANVGEGRKLSVVGQVNFYLYLYKKVFLLDG